MRDRFLRDGMDSLQDHEVLELLLFYAIARQDTNELAHRLINRFGSLSDVFDAPVAVSYTHLDVYKRQDLTIDVDEVIAKAQAENVKMIVFSNPCNPTSLGLPREEVRRLIRSVDALVVLDEAYMDFWDQSLLGEVEDYDNLIILRTCSKAIGAAALRLGFAVAAPRLTRVLRAVKSPYNVNSLSQAIGTLVLGEREWEAGARAQIVDSRRALQSFLARVQEEFLSLIHI